MRISWLGLFRAASHPTTMDRMAAFTKPIWTCECQLCWRKPLRRLAREAAASDQVSPFSVVE